MEGMKMNRLFFTTILVASAITANAQTNVETDSLTMETMCPRSLSCARNGYQYRNERLCRHQSAVWTNHWRHGAKQIRQRVWQYVSFHAKRQVRAGCAIQIG